MLYEKSLSLLLWTEGVVPSPNADVEAQMPRVSVIGDGASVEVIKVK